MSPIFWISLYTDSDFSRGIQAGDESQKAGHNQGGDGHQGAAIPYATVHREWTDPQPVQLPDWPRQGYAKTSGGWTPF